MKLGLAPTTCATVWVMVPFPGDALCGTSARTSAEPKRYRQAAPTVSRRSGPNNLIRRAIRHPGDVLSLAGGRRLRLAVIAIGAVPARPRGVLLRTLERVTRPARRGDHAVIGPIRILVLDAAGRRREASVEALRMAAEARPITRRRLAAAALAVTDVALADAILERGRDVEAHPEDPHDPSTMALLGEIDVAAGRYEEAIEHLEGAVAGGARLSPWQRTLLPRARAELRVLDPAWRPSLAPRVAAADHTSTGQAVASSIC